MNKTCSTIKNSCVLTQDVAKIVVTYWYGYDNAIEYDIGGTIDGWKQISGVENPYSEEMYEFAKKWGPKMFPPQHFRHKGVFKNV